MNDNFDLSKLKKTEKKRINSRTKGNTFERKVAEMLNERFKTTDFCRSPGSGAFATTHKLPEHLQVYGDLITPKNFKFIIECKKGYNKEGLESVFNPNSILNEMIAQAARDSNKANRFFLLIIAQDRKDPIVFTNKYCPSMESHWFISMHRTILESYYAMDLKEFLTFDDSFFFN